MQRYLNCHHVKLSGLDIYNHANLNNDGLDIDSSDDVMVSDCFIDSSDDAICIKSEGENPAKNIVITNCVIATHASAIKTGTGSVGGFENISISNVVIRRSKSKVMMHPLKAWGGLTGIDILTTDGGPLRNIVISNITMEGVENPLHIRLGNRLSGNVSHQGYSGDGDQMQGVKPGNESAKVKNQFILQDVTISGIVARDVGPYPVIIAGFEGHPVTGVTLRDVSIRYGTPGTGADMETPPNWNAGGYPGRGMYGTHLPVYGLITNYTKDLVIENFRAVPAPGEVRPMELHLNRQ